MLHVYYFIWYIRQETDIFDFFYCEISNFVFSTILNFFIFKLLRTFILEKVTKGMFQ